MEKTLGIDPKHEKIIILGASILTIVLFYLYYKNSIAGGGSAIPTTSSGQPVYANGGSTVTPDYNSVANALNALGTETGASITQLNTTQVGQATVLSNIQAALATLANPVIQFADNFGTSNGLQTNSSFDNKNTNASIDNGSSYSSSTSTGSEGGSAGLNVFGLFTIGGGGNSSSNGNNINSNSYNGSMSNASENAGSSSVTQTSTENNTFTSSGLDAQSLATIVAEQLNYQSTYNQAKIDSNLGNPNNHLQITPQNSDNGFTSGISTGSSNVNGPIKPIFAVSK